MIEIFLLAVGLFAAFCIGLVAGAGVVAQRIRRIAHDVLAELPAGAHVARAAIGDVVTRLDAPRR